MECKCLPHSLVLQHDNEGPSIGSSGGAGLVKQAAVPQLHPHQPGHMVLAAWVVLPWSAGANSDNVKIRVFSYYYSVLKGGILFEEMKLKGFDDHSSPISSIQLFTCSREHRDERWICRLCTSMYYFKYCYWSGTNRVFQNYNMVLYFIISVEHY